MSVYFMHYRKIPIFLRNLRLFGGNKYKKHIMEKIATLVRDSTDERFDDEQDHRGRKWRALTQATIKRKTTKSGKVRGTGGGRFKGILKDSGGLRDSIRGEADHKEAKIGTDKNYGAFHQFGTKHIPKRPFLGLSKDDKKNIPAIIQLAHKSFIQKYASGNTT